MTTRIVIAVLSVAIVGVASVASSLAQTPEKSAQALAAQQAPSEASDGTPAMATKAASPSRSFSVDRSGKDTTRGQAALIWPTSSDK
jgi:hypothetical protein